MKQNIKRPTPWAAVFFLGAFVLLAHCTKPEQDLGIGLQDQDRLLQLSGIDTFTVRSFTLIEDSIRSDKFNPGLVGAYNDPIFGFSKAEHITELRLTSANPRFVDVNTSLADVVVDSLILTLSYHSNFTNNKNDAGYGKLGPMYINVFEITDSLGVDKELYHRRNVNYIDEDLVLPGSNLITPRPEDTLLVGGVAALPKIRLPLNTSLAQKIIAVNQGQGISAAEFATVVKGIYITVDESQFDLNESGIVYFDTFTQLSRLSMYYRNTATDTILQYDFVIRNNSGKFGRFEQDYINAEAPLRAQVLEGIKDAGQRDLYIQAMGSTKIRVELPHIEKLREEPGILINLAVLTVPVRAETIDIYRPPVNFLIFGVRDDESLFLLPDQLDGGEFVGGFYDTANQRYRFTVTRYLQQVISNNREFNGFEIVAANAAYSANRVVLNGPEYPDPASPENNMKLEIVFTKF